MEAANAMMITCTVAKDLTLISDHSWWVASDIQYMYKCNCIYI